MLLPRAVLSRRRVQDPPAADRVRRRERTDHEAVAGDGHQRALEAQLRQSRLPRLQPLALDGRDAGGGLAGAVVHVHAGAPRERARSGQQIHLHVEQVPGRRCCVAVDHHVPALDFAALDPGEVERDSLSCLGPGARLGMHLHPADPRTRAAGLDPDLRAPRDAPGPERPRHDGADALQREAAVDVQPRRTAEAGSIRSSPRGVLEPLAQLVEARAARRADAHHRRARERAGGQQLLDLCLRERAAPPLPRRPPW